MGKGFEARGKPVYLSICGVVDLLREVITKDRFEVRGKGGEERIERGGKSGLYYLPVLLST